MNLLERVQISKLWGQCKVDLKLEKNVSFLIGPNGSGKTTIINVIVAALSVDINALLQVPFRHITVTLKQCRGRKKPVIEVEKSLKKIGVPRAIIYKIRESTSGKPKIYTLEGIDDFSHHLMSRRNRHMYASPSLIHEPNVIRRHLSQLFNLTWLSIHRSRSFRRLEDEETYDSTVDNKLADLSNEFVRFFSSLSQEASKELIKFQESVFLSLLLEEGQMKLISLLKQMNIETEKEALIEIYEELQVGPDKFRKRVNEHFSALLKVLEKIGKESRGVTAEDFTTLMTNSRVHQVVKEWKILRDRQKKIFEPRVAFLRVLNNLVQNKEFSINSQNELTATLVDKSILSLDKLSSGEKQMVIILGEALLQHETPSIYIADEPELSLHVEWQQSLVNNVLNINPVAQILFATHSPDIVGSYSNGAIDVREILK